MNESKENQHLKEQVRIKKTELNKVRVERTRQDEKVQFLQETVKKKIDSLHAKIEEQEEEIQYYHNRGRSRDLRNEADKPEKPAEIETAPPDTLAQKEHYLKTLKLLKELKTKNNQLGLKLDHEQTERDRLTREKGILTREIKRMRQDPQSQSATGLHDSAQNIEVRMEEARVRHEQLLKEKDLMISSYEAAIKSATNSGEASPSAIKNLAQNLVELRQEKTQLEQALARERKQQKAQFNRQIVQLEMELAQKIKRKFNHKKRSHDSSSQEIFQEESNSWITTYADLATLLMTFFILYYSLGQMDIQKIRDVVEDGGPPEELQSLIKAQMNPQSLEVVTGLRQKQIVEDMDNLSQQLQNQTEVEFKKGDSLIILRLPGETMFKSGSADLNLQTSREALEEIVKVAKKYPAYKIEVKGHTDDVPIDSEKFPTNWELSAARAAAVLRYFLDKNIKSDRISASGYADTFPLADNNTEPGRKLNRRVEIVLEKEG